METQTYNPPDSKAGILEGEKRTSQKKICLLGDFAVGKTSLIWCFVEGRFDDKYQSSMGVKISRKIITRPYGEFFLSSARTGEHAEAAFLHLVEQIEAHA